MMRGTRRQDSRLWPVLAMLLAAALLPTVCVLWFMGEAIRNERLATRQRLLDAYRVPLEQARTRLDRYWQERRGTEVLSDETVQAGPGAMFQALAGRGDCDSLVLCDSAGNVLYPDASVCGREEATAASEWAAAELLEFKSNDPVTAAAMYSKVAQLAEDTALVVRARIACARCRLQTRQKPEAIRLLTQVLEDARLQEVRDVDGRLLTMDAGLLLLGLLDAGQDLHKQLARRLARDAADYEHRRMPATQRRAAMEQLALVVGTSVFPTLAAERLAAEYTDAQPQPAAPGRLAGSSLPRTGRVWQLGATDGTSIALYRDERLASALSKVIESERLSGATIRLLQPDEREAEGPFLTIPAAEAMPGWRLVLSLEGPDPLADEARRRATMYLWTGLAVAAVTVSLTLLVGRHVGKQVRLTRLKNDLIATVSHELKTPLSGIRALVDTLLASDARDPRQTREYLELVARENLRLSRLIDNFLAFSRMERNKHAFELTDVSPAEVVALAVDAAGDRFHAPGCCLEVQADPDLPAVVADRDALVTALLNLLDNAWKYTGDEKQIGLRAYSADGRVRFEVRDNGIGLSRRAARRVFDRFYQADQSLSRKAGGCGLGLSIVRFIVEAHGGEVEARSQPGKGSTFVVSLPAQTAGASSNVSCAKAGR